jgi:hypothetical protein
MTKTGRLTITNEDSRLDGTLLARKGAPDPFGSATSFLRNLGLRDGDCITVSGENGTIGSVSVIFITSASKADESLCVGAPLGAEGMRVGPAASVKRTVGAKRKTKAAKKKVATPRTLKTIKKKRPTKTVGRSKSKKGKSRRRR